MAGLFASRINQLCVDIYGPAHGERAALKLLEVCTEFRPLILAGTATGSVDAAAPATSNADAAGAPLLSASDRNVTAAPQDEPAKRRFSQRDVILIAYPDHFVSQTRSPLKTLSDWCHAHLQDLVR